MSLGEVRQHRQSFASAIYALCNLFDGIIFSFSKISPLPEGLREN